MRSRGRRGNMAMEVAMFMPVMMLLIVGTIQIGKIAYIYYTLKKTLFAAAGFLSAQQGVDFCGDSNGLILAAKNFALTGTTDGANGSFLPALTPDLMDIEPECFDPVTQAVGQCDLSGCGTAQGTPHPDFIVVSIPSGYQIAPRLPFIVIDPFPLRPEIRVPFGGT